MKAKKAQPGLCQIVVRRIDLHFEQSHRQRRYEILRDPLFIEGLMDHIIDYEETGVPYVACPDCWQQYHDLLAAAREDV